LKSDSFHLFISKKEFDMSDVSGDEAEPFNNAEFDEFQKSSKKRLRTTNDDETEEKTDELVDEEEEEPKGKRRKVESTAPKEVEQHDKDVAQPERTFVQPTDILNDQDHDPNMFVKTVNVKDFTTVLVGCCATPGCDNIVFTFAPEGLQIYTRPAQSPGIVTAFFNKEMFSEYRVTKTTQRVLEKSRLESLKKKISKEVLFIEITSWQENPGFTFSGFRDYKTGGKCKFDFNIAEIVDPVKIIDMKSLSWQWLVRTDAQKFRDNVDFIDDSNEFIKMTIYQNKVQFQGLRDTGQIGENITQDLVDSNVLEKFQALFHKKHMKVITATKDLNRSLNIAYNIPSENSPIVPVHFFYELDQAQNRSVFSCFLLPGAGDSD